MRLRKPYRVRLPEGLFSLAYDQEDGGLLEGPWDPRVAETQPDGSVALLSDGLPVVLKVKQQDGDNITLDDGTVMRFVAFQVAA